MNNKDRNKQLYRNLQRVHKRLLLFQYQHWRDNCIKAICQLKEQEESVTLPDDIIKNVKKLTSKLNDYFEGIELQIKKLNHAAAEEDTIRGAPKIFVYGVLQNDIIVFIKKLIWVDKVISYEEKERLLLEAKNLGDSIIAKIKAPKSLDTKSSLIQAGFYDEMFRVCGIKREALKTRKRIGIPFRDKELENMIIVYGWFFGSLSQEKIRLALINGSIEQVDLETLYSCLYTKEPLIEEEIKKQPNEDNFVWVGERFEIDENSSDLNTPLFP